MTMALRIFVLVIAILLCVKGCTTPTYLTQKTISVSSKKERGHVHYGILQHGELGHLIFMTSTDPTISAELCLRTNEGHSTFIAPNGDEIPLPASDTMFEIKDGVMIRSRELVRVQDLLDYLDTRPEQHSIEGLMRFIGTKGLR